MIYYDSLKPVSFCDDAVRSNQANSERSESFIMNDVAIRRSFSIILIGRLASRAKTVVRDKMCVHREIVMYDVVGEHRRIESNLISDSAAAASLPRRRQGIRRRRPENCRSPVWCSPSSVAFAHILYFAFNTVRRRERVANVGSLAEQTPSKYHFRLTAYSSRVAGNQRSAVGNMRDLHLHTITADRDLVT